MSSSKTKFSVDLPILDISQPLQPSSISTLSKACKDWGFFHIKNHEISKDLFRNLHSLSQCFFNLPCDSKLKLGPLSSIKSYTPHFIASPFFESLRVNGPNFYVSAKNSAEVLLSKHTCKFSEILHEYGSKMAELSEKILKLVLISLGGEEFERKYYEAEFKNCHGYLRINNYSFLETMEEEEEEEEEDDDEQVEGLGMHTDMSCITILYQDDIGGLQVRSKDGNWVDIGPSEGTLVVNIGDMLQAWSNERLRSSEHRVVLQKKKKKKKKKKKQNEEVMKKKNRFSMAFFWCFEDEKVIMAPDDILVGSEGCNKRMYKPFVCKDYLRFRENNEKGRFEKVGFTVRDFAGIKAQL